MRDMGWIIGTTDSILYVLEYFRDEMFEYLPKTTEWVDNNFTANERAREIYLSLS